MFQPGVLYFHVSTLHEHVTRKRQLPTTWEQLRTGQVGMLRLELKQVRSGMRGQKTDSLMHKS